MKAGQGAPAAAIPRQPGWSQVTGPCFLSLGDGQHRIMTLHPTVHALSAPEGNMPHLESLVVFLLIGLAAGWLAGWLTKGRGFGWVGNLVIGVLGALVGGFLFRLLGFLP